MNSQEFEDQVFELIEREASVKLQIESNHPDISE